MRAKQGLLKGLNPTVTLCSLAIVVAFVVFCGAYGNEATGVFKTASDAILDNIKWFYIALISGVLAVLLVIGCSRYGALRLGRPDEKPEFSFAAWIQGVGGMHDHHRLPGLDHVMVLHRDPGYSPVERGQQA